MPLPPPRLIIKRKPASIFDYEFEDFEIADYQSHAAIKAPVAVQLLSSANSITAVMVHVSDVPAALTWYARAFPHATRRKIAMPTFEFEYLDVDGVLLEVVPADEKVSSGASGSVVYWQVPDFGQALAHVQSIGATIYRGPNELEDGKRMCQVQDPWGNCMGLRG